MEEESKEQRGSYCGLEDELNRATLSSPSTSSQTVSLSNSESEVQEIDEEACKLLTEMWIYEQYVRQCSDFANHLSKGKTLIGLSLPSSSSSSSSDQDQGEDEKRKKGKKKPCLNIFGVPLNKRYNPKCLCPRCHLQVAASSFTMHLQRCMGLGRTGTTKRRPV